MRQPTLVDIIADLQDTSEDLDAEDVDFGDPDNDNITIPEITDLSGVVSYYASEYVFKLKVENVVKDFQIAAVANSCGFMDSNGFKWKLETGAGHLSSTDPVSKLCFVNESRKACEARVSKISGS